MTRGAALTVLVAALTLTLPLRAAPVVDGTASTVSSSSASAVVTLTTSDSNDIIVIVASSVMGSGGVNVVSSVTATGLTFALLNGTNGNASGSFTAGGDVTDLEIWTATAATPLSSKAITVTWNRAISTGAFPSSGNVVAFGVNGAVAPWDPNATLPSYTSNAGGGNLTNTFSTTLSSDLIIWASGYPNSAQSAPCAVGTALAVQQFGVGSASVVAACTKSVSSPQSGLTLTAAANAQGSAIVVAASANGLPTSAPAIILYSPLTHF